MLFFDFEKIFLLAKGNSKSIVQLIRRMVSNPEMCKPLLGMSFIINESIIIDNPRKLSDRQLAEYLGILSFRSYAEYKFTGDSSLDMQYLPTWVHKSVVEENPLIAINKSKLTFIEEIKYG